MKTLVITGGSSGIGKATVKLFRDKGYKIFDLSRHGDSHDGITHLVCDVTSPDDCQRAIKTVIDDCGRIDVLISNAGMGISGAIEFARMDDIHHQIDINFYGAVNITQAALPYMRKARGGRIIFISSLAGMFGLPFQAFYSVSKFAVVGFAMALRNEMRPFGVKVLCMMPGDVRTGFTAARKKNHTGCEIYTSMVKSVKGMEHDEMNGVDPMDIAKALLKLAENRWPCAMNTVGAKYKFFVLLGKILPSTLAYWIVGKMYSPAPPRPPREGRELKA